MRQKQTVETQISDFIESYSALTGIKRQICALVAGGLTALAQAPLHFLPICFLTFPLLMLLLDGVDRHRVFSKNRFTLTRRKCSRFGLIALTGWSFGFGYFVIGLWWIGYMMLTDGDAFGWLMLPLATLGLPALMAAYYAVAVLIQTLLARHGLGRILALGFGFGVAEWLRGILFTGFPWNAIGYSALPSPLLMQIAAVIGLNGVNVLAVLIYTMPVLLIDRKTSSFERWTGVALGVGLICLIVGFGAWRLHGLPAVEDVADSVGTRVRLVQPSIAQQEKMDDRARLEIFNRHLHLSQMPPENGQNLPDLIVWPETSVPYILAYNQEAVAAIADMLTPRQLALVGTVRAEWTSNPAQAVYYNSLEIINAQAEIVGHADKTHLVPFGEYLPWPDFFKFLGLHAAAEMTGGYSAGANHVSLRVSDQVTILPLICYEAIFANEMDYQGGKANVLLNISNDAWYGATFGPPQHFHQARLRAIEQGMPLIRSANNGISAVVDPYGRIIASLQLDDVGFIDATIPAAIQPIWQGGAGALQFFVLLAVLWLAIGGFKLKTRTYRQRCAA